MKKISVSLWFDKEARDAAKLYVSLFSGAKINRSYVLSDTPSGEVESLAISLPGLELELFSAGPDFKFNPSISLAIACETSEEVDQLYAKLSPGGKVLMELAAYPFSERYAWITDKFGLSWQIMKANKPITQKIVPTLMFVGKVSGKAEEAINLYTSIFDNSASDFVMRYGAGEEPDKEGTIKYGSFKLWGQEFAAMDSALKHDFSFNEAISLVVPCDTQEEIDYFFEKLSSDPAAVQCGWIKDKFGVSWQIVPGVLEEMLADSDKTKVARVTKAFLEMKKFNLSELHKAFKGK